MASAIRLLRSCGHFIFGVIDGDINHSRFRERREAAFVLWMEEMGDRSGRRFHCSVDLIIGEVIGTPLARVRFYRKGRLSPCEACAA